MLSNKTHYSLADPEARISVKPGKTRALNYLCSMAVDEGYGLISYIQADFADRRDSVLLPSIVDPLCTRLAAHELLVREVAADTNYSNDINYALLEARGITLWIPVFGRYKPEIEGFTYDARAAASPAPLASCFLSALRRTQMDGWASATPLSPVIAASAHTSQDVRQKAKSGSSCVQLMMSTTARHLLASKVGKSGTCAGCDSVR